MRQATFVVVAVLAAGLQGCGGMSMFGGGSKQAAVASDTTAAAPGAAAEQPKKRQPQSMRLARFDENQDGIVTKAELESTLQADFKKEDANQNQVLDPAEARALNERLRTEDGTSPIFDWNADGKIVYAEFATQWRTLFDRSDRNQDGVVDSSEMSTVPVERKPRLPPKPTFSGSGGRAPGSP
jgi:Ca2+-binding EF-hand superfamily protein